MKKYWKIIGIVTLLAGIIYYPALKVYQYLTREKLEDEDTEPVTHVKLYSPAYRGKHILPSQPRGGNGKIA